MKILKKLMKPFHRKIKTPAEYEASMKLFSALMDKGEELSADEADYMDLLGTLLEDYERTTHPETETFLDRRATPVEAIRWAMDRHGLRQKDLCPYIGSEQLISAIMNEDYIAKRRAATKSFQDKVRALPEYAAAQAEVEQENVLANLMIEARERAGFTQAQVAAKMGIGQSAFSRMERGNTTIKNFLKCLKICGYALQLVPDRRVAACL